MDYNINLQRVRLIRVVITRAWSALFPDGVNTFVFELGAAMIRKDHEVHIVSGCGPYAHDSEISYLFDVDEIPEIHYVKKEEFRSRVEEVMYWLANGTSVLRGLEPDVTIMNGVVPCWPPGVRIIVCHGLKTGGSYPMAQKLYDCLMYRAMGSLVAVSQPLKREIASELRFMDVTVIPIGLDTRRYSSLPLDRRERAILHVGTRSVKNLSTTLKAFKIISKKIPEVKLYITGSDIVQHQDLIKNELKDRIRFLGIIARRELSALYSKVTVVSAPSFYEAFPYVTLEAFASGTPVVGSEAIPKELLVDRYNGYRITSPKDHLALANRLQELFLNASKWRAMSSNAKATALNYDIQKIAEAYLNLARRPREHRHSFAVSC